jgi:hypothetical protein
MSEPKLSYMPYPYWNWNGEQENKIAVMINGYTCRTTNYYAWGRHNNRVMIGNFVLYFHYNMPIAFKDEDNKLIITRNEKGATSIGRALNSLDRNKDVRISWNDFYNKLLKRMRTPLIKPSGY